MYKTKSKEIIFIVLLKIVRSNVILNVNNIKMKLSLQVTLLGLTLDDRLRFQVHRENCLVLSATGFYFAWDKQNQSFADVPENTCS